jgi:hypothetical protein
MKTLFVLFYERRTELQQQLDGAPDLEEAVRLVQRQLDVLQREYIGDLSTAQARWSAFFLDVVRSSIGALVAAHKAETWYPQPPQTSSPFASFSYRDLAIGWPQNVFKAIIYIGIFIALLTLTPPTAGVWVTILLVVLLVGLELARQPNSAQHVQSFRQKLANAFQRSDRGERYRHTQVNHAPKIIVRVDSKALLDHLADALGIIDRAVAEATGREQPNSPAQLEDLSELLDFLQDLLGDSILEEAQSTLKRTKTLPHILMTQGIELTV